MDQVTLLSVDNHPFTLLVSDAMKSKTLDNLMRDSGTSSVIPLPIESLRLKRVVTYLRDGGELGPLELMEALELTIDANFLDIKDLMEKAGTIVATIFKNGGDDGGGPTEDEDREEAEAICVDKEE